MVKPHSSIRRKHIGGMHAQGLRGIWPAVLLLVWILAPHAALGSSLVYKNYIVRYDRGWDVLCEPYVVERGDWVLKIFRQKGEIANQDFRDFLGIFQRLNPHVPDIDLVQPGQAIDIPLRKLEHGALPGQDSGVVTIPIVTLSKDKDLETLALKTATAAYDVQRGDTVSQIVSRRYGRPGTKAYKEGVALLQAANPEIKDINHIFAGQKIHLPDPATREKQWEAMAGQEGGTGEPFAPDQPTDAQGDAFSQSPETAPPAAAPQTPQDPLAAAAATVGGRLLGKGTYYVPREGATDFEIDLSRHPLMELGSHRLFFSQDGKIMGQAPEPLEKQWPQAKVVSYNKEDSAQEIIAAIFDSVEDEDNAPTLVAFEDQGVHVAVRAKWVKPESDGRQLCITPIQTIGEQTPESMRRYLEQNSLVLKEVLPGGAAVSSSVGGNRHAVKNILALTPTSQRDFAQGLSKALHFSYAPNVPVTFPYAGVQIEAFANLVATLDGREVLLDFGELYGGAAKAIQESGLNLVQIGAEDSHLTIAAKLLAGLGVRRVENPSF
ncbi:MAG: LysM peptidoglycan-binding domain-containing protein, partial [Desulfatitalea sp.]|nr:LysM peptidoglycan-binding domain-containing protein [Desulfatitalea sp.]